MLDLSNRSRVTRTILITLSFLQIIRLSVSKAAYSSIFQVHTKRALLNHHPEPAAHPVEEAARLGQRNSVEPIAPAPCLRQSWREYPRRTVDWSQFKSFPDPARHCSDVVIDIPPEQSNVSDWKKPGLAGQGLRKIAEWIIAPLGRWREKRRTRWKDMMIQVEDDCPICLDAYADHPSLIFPGCNHVFHGRCLRTWLQTSPATHSPLSQTLLCPLCRLPAPTTSSLFYSTQIARYYLFSNITFCACVILFLLKCCLLSMVWSI